MIAAVEGTQTAGGASTSGPSTRPSGRTRRVYRRISLVPLGPESTGELLRRPGRRGPLARRARRADPRAHRRQPLLHRGGRPRAGRGRHTWRASAAPTGWCGRSRTPACRPPCRRSSPPGSTASSPAAKQLLQAASVIGKEFPSRRCGGDRGPRGRARSRRALKELIDGGFLYEAEIYPERVLAFRHPLTREVAYGSQLGEQRAAAHAATARALIELNPDRHDELAALIAQHLEEGGETLEAARWSARAAHWAGHSHPQDALRLWRKVTELDRRSCRERGDDGAGGVLADAAARLRLAARDGQGARRVAGRRGARDRHQDGGPALAGPAATARLRPVPGWPTTPTAGSPPSTRRSRLADESRRRCTCGSRFARPAPTRYLCAGDFDQLRAARRRGARDGRR